ncbi:hypothetical protein E2C01_039933 [Portunus trituberculatus]|uniref:Uncharacterized protein n=1 Tax=Portunus trituberculatus TaxID=210409 RepID=A0A5B7FLY7_PORTR|nr:hypothetical protein [Portunus trituberculatus]
MGGEGRLAEEGEGDLVRSSEGGQNGEGGRLRCGSRRRRLGRREGRPEPPQPAGSLATGRRAENFNGTWQGCIIQRHSSGTNSDLIKTRTCGRDRQGNAICRLGARPRVMTDTQAELPGWAEHEYGRRWQWHVCGGEVWASARDSRNNNRVFFNNISVSKHAQGGNKSREVCNTRKVSYAKTRQSSTVSEARG